MKRFLISRSGLWSRALDHVQADGRWGLLRALRQKFTTVRSSSHSGPRPARSSTSSLLVGPHWYRALSVCGVFWRRGPSYRLQIFHTAVLCRHILGRVALVLRKSAVLILAGGDGRVHVRRLSCSASRSGCSCSGGLTSPSTRTHKCIRARCARADVRRLL
jgi:hypothetical protein